MKDNESHSFENSFLKTVDDPILYLFVRDMSPPDQNVGLFETRLGQTMLQLLKSSCTYRERIVISKTLCDTVVHSVRVEFSDCFRFLLMDVLAPDNDSYSAHTCHR